MTGRDYAGGMSIRADIVPSRRFAGVVLAGGRSLRMGRDKALLPLIRSGRQTSLLDNAVSLLSGLCATVLVSCASRAGYAGHDCIPDLVLPRQDHQGPRPPHLGEGDTSPGPLLGLVSSLHYARARGWEGILTLPCDMPLMRPALLAGLLKAAREHAWAQALFYRTAGGWEEPLVVYGPARSSGRPVLRQPPGACGPAGCATLLSAPGRSRPCLLCRLQYPGAGGGTGCAPFSRGTGAARSACRRSGRGGQSFRMRALASQEGSLASRFCSRR